MDGLDFQTAIPPTASHPARADIACFVGFTARRPVPPRAPEVDEAARLRVLPAGLRDWLQRMGWEPGRNGRDAEDILQLIDIPVPLHSWDAFDALFAWDRRPLDASGRFCETILGAAVRRFFSEGGRKCYVVRVGDPWPLLTPRTVRQERQSAILPSIAGGPRFELPTPLDRSTWRGMAHLLGLPDVSFLCIPDLPDLFAIDVGNIPPESSGEVEERFVECSTRLGPEASNSLRALPPPRCDDTGFAAWGVMVRQIADFLRRQAREVQFIAALPLAADETALAAKAQILALERSGRRSAIRSGIFSAQQAQWREAGSIQSAFVQLAYPWLRSRLSRRLPGDVESPDAYLAGILAHNALTAGTWQSASRRPVRDLATTIPILARSDLERELPFEAGPGTRRRPLALRQRVSVFIPTSLGHQLLSDVTTDDDEVYRPANVNRLVASIVRAARTLGEEAVFTNNGEALWNRVRASMEGLLLNLWSDGALSGATQGDAFEVHCDRSTMSQNDIDAGRVITRVQFTTAAPIEHITVVLALDDAGVLSLVSTHADTVTEEAG